MYNWWNSLSKTFGFFCRFYWQCSVYKHPNRPLRHWQLWDFDLFRKKDREIDFNLNLFGKFLQIANTLWNATIILALWTQKKEIAINCTFTVSDSAADAKTFQRSTFRMWWQNALPCSGNEECQSCFTLLAAIWRMNLITDFNNLSENERN